MHHQGPVKACSEASWEHTGLWVHVDHRDRGLTDLPIVTVLVVPAILLVSAHRPCRTQGTVSTVLTRLPAGQPATDMTGVGSAQGAISEAATREQLACHSASTCSRECSPPPRSPRDTCITACIKASREMGFGQKILNNTQSLSGPESSPVVSAHSKTQSRGDQTI